MTQIARKIAPDAAERRATSRPDLGRPGTIRIGAGEPIDIMLGNLTRDGCRIETGAELTPGVDVQVGLAHVGLIPGRIVWQSQKEYGCRFDVSLAPGIITAAYGASNVAAFPLTAPPALSVRGKSSPRVRLVVIAGLVAATWAGTIAIAVALAG